MSKTFKGKTCTYCKVPESSTTGDHVLAREFFPIDQRNKLPKVPACDACNGTKSSLKHYLTAVLPFGATHPDSSSVLATMVPSRLAKNARLQHELAAETRRRFISRDGIDWEPEMTLPLDGERLAHLLDYITRGLAFHHFDLLSPETEYFVHTEFHTAKGRELFDRFFNGAGRRIEHTSLGNGIFQYDAIQSLESQHLTMWRMTLAGVAIGNDTDAANETVRLAYGTTGPLRLAIATDLVQRLRPIRFERAA